MRNEHKYVVRDEPLEKLWGRGGVPKYKKIHAREILEKKVMHSEKKNVLEYKKNVPPRETLSKEISCSPKIPRPPITFLMVRP